MIHKYTPIQSPSTDSSCMRPNIQLTESNLYGPDPDHFPSLPIAFEILAVHHGRLYRVEYGLSNSKIAFCNGSYGGVCDRLSLWPEGMTNST